MLVVAVVILAGVVAVASGRGGEMAVPEPDYPPIDLGPVSAADVALLRPPSAAWGYNMRVTDEALEVIARAVTERDVQIAALQQQVSDLREQLGGTWPAEAGAPRADGAAEPAFPATSSALESPGAAAEDPDDMGRPEYLESPGYRSELDDPLTPAGQADPGATAEQRSPEPGGPASGGPASGGPEQTTTTENQLAPGEVPDPAWPGENAPHVPGSGSGPAAPVAITRPQPIYRHPAAPDGPGPGGPEPGPADTVWDQPAVRPAGPSAPPAPSAPWGPARPPGEPVPPWDQRDPAEPEAPTSPQAAGIPQAPGVAQAPGVEAAQRGPEAPAAPETPSVPDDHGWGTDPADTSPDAQPLDWNAAPPPATEPGPDPSAGPAEPEPTDWDGRSQPSPAPSVWDVASRQVDEDQARHQPPRRAPAGRTAEFIWDEDPHQTVVWGAEHARAKAARTAEETRPNSEQRDDERG